MSLYIIVHISLNTRLINMPYKKVHKWIIDSIDNNKSESILKEFWISFDTLISLLQINNYIL
jgi:hypothetical protein